MSKVPREKVGRYRKLYPRFWRHPGSRALNKGAREVALYALTGPQTNRIGIFHFSLMTAADDLTVGVDTLRERVRDVTLTFGWLFDADARVFYIPSWWRWNQPENEDVLKGNLNDISDLPPCGLVEAFATNLEHIPAIWHHTFIEGCQRRLPTRVVHQEQEQGTETGTRTETGRAPRGAFNGKNQDSNLLKIAREALSYVQDRSDTDLLLNTFFSLQRHQYKQEASSRDEVLQALNVALSEARPNAAH